MVDFEIEVNIMKESILLMFYRFPGKAKHFNMGTRLRWIEKEDKIFFCIFFHVIAKLNVKIHASKFQSLEIA